MNLSWQIVRLNLKETFSIAYGKYTHREALIITLDYRNCKGYGECTSIDYYHINLNDFTQKLQLLKPVIEGQQIIHPNSFYAFLLTLELPSFLRSAIDCAYWDLYGKLEQTSFLDLNEIKVTQLPESSITISVDTIENQIKKIEQSTWNKFKVKCNHFDTNAVKALAQLDATIALDSNGSFSKDECLWLENESLAQNFSYMEQPMKTGVENFSALHSDLYANWMADEDFQDSSDLKTLKPHYRSINIKLVKCGGLTPALQLIKEARTLGFKIMMGCMTESTVGISAGAALAPLVDYADLDGANLIANDIATGSTIVNGKILLGEGHGLGIKMH